VNFCPIFARVTGSLGRGWVSVRPCRQSGNVSDQPLNAPRHPTIGRRCFVAWAGYHSGARLPDVDRRVIGAVAAPLPHALRNQTLISAALEAGMGVVLPGQTWRNQLPDGHEKRAGAFKKLRAYRQRSLDIDRRLSGSFAERYAEDDTDDQLAAGATIVTTPGHVLEQEAGDGRQNDLLLARLAAGHFADRGGWAPAPGRSGRREVYATIVVSGSNAANASVIDWLVRAYAPLEGIDGYWIIGVNVNNSGRQVRGFFRLAHELERVTGRPSVTFGVGDPHLALLASGLAATCAGLHGMRFRFPPIELPRSEDPEEDAPGLGVHTYHSAVLGNVGVLGSEGDGVREALFSNRPCSCGFHPADAPPLSWTQKVRHNLAALQSDIAEVALGESRAAEARLLARAEQARRERRFYGLTRLHAGFGSVPDEAQLLRDRREESGQGTD
jgi:hypothetical protein